MMRVTFVAHGTRGDVQPILALSRSMRDRGHEVTVVAGTNFGDWVSSMGLHFVPTVDMEQLMSSDEGVEWARRSQNPLAQLKSMKTILDAHAPAVVNPIIEAARHADVMVSGAMSEPFVQAIASKFGAHHVHAALQPTRVSRDPAASLAPVRKSKPSVLNAAGGRLGQLLLWHVMKDALGELRSRLGLPATNARRHLSDMAATPAIFGYSPLVVPKPADWGHNRTVTGYWFLDDQEEWTAPPELERFLESGDTPVYIGFGSMPDVDSGRTAKVLLEALRMTGARAVIAPAPGGDIDPADPPEGVFVVRDVPHSWLFPKMRAVIHHGGAGTTAAGLRAGRPTLAVPHLADQFFWARRCHELGVGAPAIPRHELTAETLAHGLNALTNPALSAAASRLRARLTADDGVRRATNVLENPENAHHP